MSVVFRKNVAEKFYASCSQQGGYKFQMSCLISSWQLFCTAKVFFKTPFLFYFFFIYKSFVLRFPGRCLWLPRASPPTPRLSPPRLPRTRLLPLPSCPPPLTASPTPPRCHSRRRQPDCAASETRREKPGMARTKPAARPKTRTFRRRGRKRERTLRTLRRRSRRRHFRPWTSTDGTAAAFIRHFKASGWPVLPRPKTRDLEREAGF